MKMNRILLTAVAATGIVSAAFGQFTTTARVQSLDIRNKKDYGITVILYPYVHFSAKPIGGGTATENVGCLSIAKEFRNENNKLAFQFGAWYTSENRAGSSAYQVYLKGLYGKPDEPAWGLQAAMVKATKNQFTDWHFMGVYNLPYMYDKTNKKYLSFELGYGMYHIDKFAWRPTGYVQASIDLAKGFSADASWWWVGDQSINRVGIGISYRF